MNPYYEDDFAKIYLGDCREVLPGLRGTCVICDPPYDEKTHKGALYGFRETSSAIPFAPLESVEETVGLLTEAAERWILAFCSMEMLGDYKRAAGDLWVRSGFWRRPNGVPQFTGDRPGQPGEGIAIMHTAEKKRWNGGGRHGFWSVNIEQHGRVHPTEKPLDLMLSLVSDFTDQTDSILDPFMGSGTTLVAAKNLGRKSIGIEIEEKYCEIAAQRLSQEVLGL